MSILKHNCETPNLYLHLAWEYSIGIDASWCESHTCKKKPMEQKQQKNGEKCRREVVEHSVV